MFTILLSLTRVKNYLFRVRYHSSQFQLKTERLFPIEKRTGSDILDAHPLITQMAYKASHCSGFPFCEAQALGHTGFSSFGSEALECRLSSSAAGAYLLHGMWDLPRPGLEPLSLALTGGFFTTEPPGKPLYQTSLIC